MARKPGRDRTPWALFGVALLVRLLGIGWGLPEVFEEAYPLKVAMRMHGLERVPPTLDPGFFHYPSLVIDVQYAVLAVVKGVLAGTGVAGDVASLRWTWFANPGAFLVPARLAIALFGALMVLPAHAIASRARGRAAGVLAGLLVAFSPLLVRKSQFVDVDVPMACLVLFALAAIDALARAKGRNETRAAAWCGALVGLATSAKYPGVLALVPLALVLAWRVRRKRASASEMLAAAGCAFAAFALTAPYFFLSSRVALHDLAAEREHLKLGHFGSDEGWSAPFYAHAWFALSVGWLTGAAALGGAFLGARKREPWALILLAFLVPLLLVLGSAALRADRYLVPAIAPACVLAAVFLFDVAQRRFEPTLRDAVVIAALCLLADGSRIARHVRELGPDTRTLSRKWIEANLPGGSMVALEPYGPELPGPLRRLSAGVEMTRDVRGPQYWTILIPLFQVEPERSAVYYDPALYRAADAFVVSGSARDRYLAEPDRFPAQNAFYGWLGSTWREAVRLRPHTGTGSEIVIYRNPGHTVPFGSRVVPAPPPSRLMQTTGGRDGEAVFYRNFGMNFLGFGHYAEARESFALALRFPATAGADRGQIETAYRIARGMAAADSARRR